jgi:uncharacterized damage-inducible protein DinB
VYTIRSPISRHVANSRLGDCMEITTIAPFLDYYGKVRQRTLRVIKCVPPDKIDWTYKEGKFTLADLIRHIAAIERYMYAETVQFKKSIYPGAGRELADGYDQVVEFFNRCHDESMQVFSKLSDEDLRKKCITPDGSPITVWKWLRAMVEHEIHHRGQIYQYLGILDVPTPPIYGLTSEQVAERGRQEKESSQDGGG